MATELRLLFVTTNAGSASAVSMVVVLAVVLTSPRTTSPSVPARTASGRANAPATPAASAPAAAPRTARRLVREVPCSIVAPPHLRSDARLGELTPLPSDQDLSRGPTRDLSHPRPRPTGQAIFTWVAGAKDPPPKTRRDTPRVSGDPGTFHRRTTAYHLSATERPRRDLGLSWTSGTSSSEPSRAIMTPSRRLPATPSRGWTRRPA